MTDLSPAAPVLRAHDRERFQTSLFAPAPARQALIALYAFDCELGRVRHVVSQPMAGLIRLQWWRDAVQGIFADQTPAHPVARAMHAVKPLLVPHQGVLETSIDAREVTLEPMPFRSMADLERHLEATAGGIGRSAVAVLKVDRAADAASRVFRAWAIIGLLSEIEADRTQGRTMLPVALLEEHGVDPERIADVRDAHALRAPVRDMVGRALELLRDARRELRAPAAALPALLLAPLATDALRRLEARGYDHSSAWRRPSPFAPLRLLWQQARGRF